MSTGNVQVADEHVDQLEGQVVEQSIGVRLRAPIEVDSGGAQGIGLAFNLNGSADLCGLDKFSRDAPDGIGGNPWDFRHPLLRVIAQKVGPDAEASAKVQSRDLIFPIECDVVWCDRVPRLGRSQL